jgi:hypothetical protein
MKLKNVFSIIAMLLIVFMIGCEKTDDNGLPPVVVNPSVNSTDPINNATGVAINRMMVVTFNEPMDPATINSLTFTLKQGTTPVAGTVAYTGTTATFTPSTSLVPNTIYTETITTGSENIEGIALADNYTVSFTTYITNCKFYRSAQQCHRCCAQ